MATFITSRSVGQFVSISITTSTGYWKSNHNGTDSTVFTNGPFWNLTVQNANGEFTIIPCDIIGNPSGDITEMILSSQMLNNNQITSFDGTGLTGLTSLTITRSQLTTFDGTGLSSLTYLEISNNQLTSVNVSGLTSLALLNLNNNQLTSIDVSTLTNLTNLSVNNNLLDSADNDLILSQLVSNGRNNGFAYTTGGRTSAGTNDFMTLQSRGWFLEGFNDNTTTTTTTSAPTTTTTTTSTPTTTTTTTSGPPPTQPVTFVTSKAVGQKIYPTVFTGTGYWRVYHNNSYSAIYSVGPHPFGISVENPNGEFTVIACDISGNPGGIINELNLGNNQLTSFNGTGLTSLTSLNLSYNQLTSIDVSPLTNLNNLVLSNNQLTSIDVSTLTNLTNLSVNNNLLDSADNDLILSQLVANGKNSGYVQTTGGRRTNDFMTLQSRGWFLIGFSVTTTTTTTTAAPTTTTTTTLGPTISRKLRIKGINQI